MSKERLLEAIGEIDDLKIQSARVVSPPRKKYSSVIKFSTIAAAIAIVAVLVNYMYGASQKVVYAASYDSISIMNYDENDKLFVSEEIKAQKDNSLMRVAIWVRALMDAYPDVESDIEGFQGYTFEALMEYSNQLDNQVGSISDAEYREKSDKEFEVLLNIQDKALSLEKKFLNKIGAKEITVQENNTFVCTISKADLNKLSEGKCKYVVVLCTKNDDDVNRKSLEDYYGEYSKVELVGIPMYSSLMPESNSSGAFSINKDRVYLKIGNFLSESTEWSYKELENRVDIGSYGIGESGSYADAQVDMLDIYSNIKAAYHITDDSGDLFDIYITPGCLYLDLGLGGIYKINP